MASMTPKQHRAGLGFADDIAALAALAPDAETKREVYSLVNSIRKRYGWRREEKIREVVRVMSLGAATVADIVRETRFREQEVKEIKAELVEQKVVRCTVLQNGAGRPAEMCFLVEDTFRPPK